MSKAPNSGPFLLLSHSAAAIPRGCEGYVSSTIGAVCMHRSLLPGLQRTFKFDNLHTTVILHYVVHTSTLAIRILL